MALCAQAILMDLVTGTAYESD